MPFIHVHMTAGRPLEKRRRLAQAITDAVTEILELEPGQTQVVIQEHERDDWAIGGELLSERRAARRDDALPDLDSLFRKPAEKPAAKPVPKPALKTPARKPAAKPRSRR
jgi:4-oxalocrotonate tautomerase